MKQEPDSRRAAQADAREGISRLRAREDVKAALYALVVAVACAVLAVRRGVRAVLSLVQHSRGPEVVRDAPEASDARSEPHSPSWARKDAA